MPLLTQAVTFRGGTSEVSQSASLTIVMTGPTGAVAGDVMLMLFQTGNASITWSLAGWTPLAAQSQTSHSSQILWRLAGASEPATYTFTSSSSVVQHGVGVAYFGVDQTTPVSVSASANSAGSSQTCTAPGLVTTVPQCMIVDGFAYNTTGTITKPASYTDRVNGNFLDFCETVATTVQTVPSANATTSATVTRNSGWSVALAPQVLTTPLPVRGQAVFRSANW